MSWNQQATASYKRMYMAQPGTTGATIYTAPAYNSNVTTPSATAVVKELIIANTTATAATITIGINGTAAANQILPTVTVNGNDVKVLDGLNIGLSGSDTLQALQGTASAITVTVCGDEIQ